MNNKSGHHPTKNLVELQENIESLNAKIPTNLSSSMINDDIRTILRSNHYTDLFTLNNGQHHGVTLDKNGRLRTNTEQTYESETLSISGTFITTAPAQNGTSIDMLNYRNLYLQIRMVGDTGLGIILDNIYVYYSLDDTTFRLGEKIELSETDSASGNYEGIIRIKDVGARYVRLYAKNRTGNPTNYLVQYSRSN